MTHPTLVEIFEFCNYLRDFDIIYVIYYPVTILINISNNFFVNADTKFCVFL